MEDKKGWYPGKILGGLIGKVKEHHGKFKEDGEKLKALDEINLYIEEIEKMYQKAS